jgi:P-type Mg2+ transporter
MKQTSDIYSCARLPITDIYFQFHTSPKGLKDADVQKRLTLYGENILIKKQKTTVVKMFISQFTGPLLIILFFASTLSFFLGHTIDALIIFSMILLSGILNFIQEYHASKAIEKIQQKAATHSNVIRSGEEIEIYNQSLVPGDIIVLRSGDIIPADGRIIEDKDFFVNESALTGESFPLRKHSHPIEQQKVSLGELTSMVFSGGHVISGSATAVVVATGASTQFGQIAKDIAQDKGNNEFTKGIHTLSVLLLKTTTVFVLILFLGQLFYRQESFIEAVLFAIAIAVGITPELLPVILSVGMAKGSINMAKKGIIVKKLSAVPTIGSMDILCSDKTGTLTEDNIQVVQYTDIHGKESETVYSMGFLNSYFQTGIKNPLDEAILSYKSLHHREYKKLDEIPFDFQRRTLSIFLSKLHEKILITKGAPEAVVAKCTHVRIGKLNKKITDTYIRQIQEQYQALSEEGYRVIAVAIKDMPLNRNNVSKHDEHELTFLGFISFFDPPKEGIKTILRDLKEMNIHIKIITGDNEYVSQHICKHVGLPVYQTLLGTQIDSLDDAALKERAEQTQLFARFSPQQKERVIRILREKGHVVGYLGDGINDAPSLKMADVGISVSNAVDIAKESADMIVTHKSLAELKDAIIDGRKILGNTMKYVYMAVSGNFGNTVSYLIATFFLPFAPMLPKQILLGNLLYDISQIGIPIDHVDDEYITKPKRWNQKAVQLFMVIFGLTSSLFDIATFVTLLSLLKLSPIQFQTGWFLASITTQILVIHVIRTKKIPFLESIASPPLLIGGLVLLSAGWLLPFTPFAQYFSLQVLPVFVLAHIIAIVGGYLITTQLVKHWFFRFIEKNS